jgi:hypothetical protein
MASRRMRPWANHCNGSGLFRVFGHVQYMGAGLFQPPRDIGAGYYVGRHVGGYLVWYLFGSPTRAEMYTHRGFWEAP